jgi:hypothetical protein
MSANTLRITYKIGTRDGRGNFKDEWLGRYFRRGMAFTDLFKILLWGRTGKAKIGGPCLLRKYLEFHGQEDAGEQQSSLLCIDNKDVSTGLVALRVHRIV